LNGETPDEPVSPLNDLLTALASGISQKTFGKFTNTQLLGSGLLSPGISGLLNRQNYSAIKPKAYVNWILFDEQFKYVNEGIGFDQVGSDEEFKTHFLAGLQVPKNGYLYIYVSNETPNVDVFFDNLQVTHVRGPLLEETHYYPFGLTMAGISSKAAGKLENRFKYNGIELNEDLGLNTYDAFFRNLDPQIGRWWQIDPRPTDYISLYSSMNNNPIINSDPLGDTTNYYNSQNGNFLGTIYGNDKYGDRFIGEDDYNKLYSSISAGLKSAIASNTKGLDSKGSASKIKELIQEFTNKLEDGLNSMGTPLDMQSNVGLLARIGFAEFRGSGSVEQQAGMDITLNRVGKKEFGMSLEGVITKRNAYSSLWDDNKGFYFSPYEQMYNKGKFLKANHNAWTSTVENAFSTANRTTSITQGATLYYSPMSMRPSGSIPKWDFRKLSEVYIQGVNPNHIRMFKYK
jgi:RHS repeat-associated protein